MVIPLVLGRFLNRPYNAPSLRFVAVEVCCTVRFRIVEDADPYGVSSPRFVAVGIVGGVCSKPSPSPSPLSGKALNKFSPRENLFLNVTLCHALRGAV